MEGAYKLLDAINTAWEERDKRELLGNRDFTYGEARFYSFYPLLNLVSPQPGEVFYDLGCGTGLPGSVAAVMFPDLASSEGAEFLENLVRIGQGAIERITQECAR